MKFTIATLVTLAVSAVAMPSVNGGDKPKQLSLSQASGLCQSGKVACCNPKKDIEGNGVLGNLLAEGLLNNLLGVGDSACASQSLIKNLNLLGFTTEGQEGTTCKNTIACCPTGEDCTALEAPEHGI
ncbi:Hydrophobin [Penicillium fimorum]|uniref:Hydrophobin n=1 Tax=Penicillium fimorum TaxID=1882269 RepID=A0A9X0CBS9_9EURO|nr:Hydrophobin [Penicillium fimorum]